MALTLLYSYQWRASANATELFVTHWRHAIGVIIQGRYGELLLLLLLPPPSPSLISSLSPCLY